MAIGQDFPIQSEAALYASVVRPSVLYLKERGREVKNGLVYMATNPTLRTMSIAALVGLGVGVVLNWAGYANTLGPEHYRSLLDILWTEKDFLHHGYCGQILRLALEGGNPRIKTSRIYQIAIPIQLIWEFLIEGPVVGPATGVKERFLESPTPWGADGALDTAGVAAGVASVPFFRRMKAKAEELYEQVRNKNAVELSPNQTLLPFKASPELPTSSNGNGHHETVELVAENPDGASEKIVQENR